MLALSVCYAECRRMCHWAEHTWGATTQISSNLKAFEHLRLTVEHWAHSRAVKAGLEPIISLVHLHEAPAFKARSQHAEILILQLVLEIRQLLPSLQDCVCGRGAIEERCTRSSKSYLVYTGLGIQKKQLYCSFVLEKGNAFNVEPEN